MVGRGLRSLACAAALACSWPALVSPVQLTRAQPGSPREEAHRQNNLGVAHLERFDYEAAAGAFRQALRLDDSLRIARLNLAIALLYTGDLGAAATEVRAVTAATPALPHGHYVAGLVARASNRPADAVQSFQRVLDLDVEDVGSRVQLGQIALAERRYAEAVEHFERAVALEPFNATAAYGLAMSRLRRGDPQASTAMARFETLREQPASITYSAGYLEQGRYGEAITSTGLEGELIDAAVPDARFEDATAAAFGDADSRGRAGLVDIDRDGDLDVVLASTGGLRLRISDTGRFTAGRIVDGNALNVTGIVAGDLDNDARVDLLVLGEDAASVYDQEADGTFRRMPLDIGSGGAPRTAALADVDHDGDLDIIVAPPIRLLRNNGNGTFTNIASDAGMAAGPAGAIALIPTDYDNHRDTDLLIVPPVGAPALFANQRDGTFRDVAPESGLPGVDSYMAASTGDVNKDGAPDFVLARAGAPAVVALSSGTGRFTVAPGPPGSDGATAVLLFDYDSDGLFDLLALTPTGARLWRYFGASWHDVTAAALPKILAVDGQAPSAMIAGDLDADGDTDLIVRLQSGQLRSWRNSAAESRPRPASVRVQLEARVSNRSAVGAKVEVRSGSLRNRIEVSAATPPAAPAGVVFGLGAREKADVVRVLWPSGILQAEVNPQTPVTVLELDRKPSSCPFLFGWNGSRFEFVTDFLGGGEMGYWIAPGVRNVPDPDEYVRIRGDQLQPRNGRYELRVTNELEEALFVDRLQLLSIDHPAGVNVYPNEGLRSPAEQRPFTVFTTRLQRTPVSARDHHGHDVADRVREIDGRYVDDFRLEPIQGFAEEHTLELNLGTIERGSPVRLLLTGWTDYAFSSDNVAAHQAGLVGAPPSLQIRSAGGKWQTVVPEVGIPVGRPQTVVVDLTPHLPRASAPLEVRITTTLRVYWDQIVFDVSTPAPYEIARLDPLEARLHSRGYSAEIPADGIGPLTYDYHRVSADDRWKTIPGRYTREGDVTPLLLATDDRFVVSASGDEIAVSFDASALLPVREGWTRTFFLYADGFSKEMNLHSSSPDQLEPLPFHAMTRYPYRPPEHYPRTPAHNRYRAEYNTRTIRGNR